MRGSQPGGPRRARSRHVVLSTARGGATQRAQPPHNPASRQAPCRAPPVGQHRTLEEQAPQGHPQSMPASSRPLLYKSMPTPQRKTRGGETDAVRHKGSLEPPTPLCPSRASPQASASSATPPPPSLSCSIARSSPSPAPSGPAPRSASRAVSRFCSARSSSIRASSRAWSVGGGSMRGWWTGREAQLLRSYFFSRQLLVEHSQACSPKGSKPLKQRSLRLTHPGSLGAAPHLLPDA